MTFLRAIGAIGVSFWTTLRQLWQPSATCQYPEEQPLLPRRWRGRPVLTRDPDGDERCVACQLCSAVCPTGCIALQAGERGDGRRYAVTFRINCARCIYCGLCEEACPTLAIQLSEEYAFAQADREHFIYEKDRLLIDGPGKHPHYNFYRHAGVAIAGKGKGEGLNEMAPVDLRSNLP